jgi:hypothetical protein
MTQQEQLIALVNEKLADYSNINPSEHREVEIAIINAIFSNAPTTARMSYEVLEIDVNISATPNFLADNFDSTGLGKSDYLGFAICNGQNGTKDRRGRVAIGYDSSAYPNLGATGGSKDAVLVSHTHTYDRMKYIQNGDQSVPGGSTPYYEPDIAGNTSTSGENGAGKNMQPYIVTLFIQKL